MKYNKMTKKHFELIARVILANKNYSLQTKEQKKAIDDLAFDLSHAIACTNYKFDTNKFLKACGIGEICKKCEDYHNDGIYHICPDNQ